MPGRRLPLCRHPDEQTQLSKLQLPGHGAEGDETKLRSFPWQRGAQTKCCACHAEGEQLFLVSVMWSSCRSDFPRASFLAPCSAMLLALCSPHPCLVADAAWPCLGEISSSPGLHAPFGEEEACAYCSQKNRNSYLPMARKCYFWAKGSCNVFLLQ